MEHLIGIEFYDYQHGATRKTKQIIDGEVYAPIIKYHPSSLHWDDDFDGDCMFRISFIEFLISTRETLDKDIKTGAKICQAH